MNNNLCCDNSQDIVIAARRYIEAGFGIFPVVPLGKNPSNAHGWKESTRSCVDLDLFIGRNIGLVAIENNLLVIDVDNHKIDGRKTFRELEHRLGELPDHPIQRSANDGCHLFFKVPKEHEKMRRKDVGIDIIINGYILVAPSKITKLDGTIGQYEWIRSIFDTNIPDLPQAWVDYFCSEPEQAKTKIASSNWEENHLGLATNDGLLVTDHVYAEAAMDDEIQRLLEAPIGTRNDQLNRSAFSLAQLVASGALDGMEVRTKLLQAAEQIGLGQRESILTISSAFKKGMQVPRKKSTTIDVPHSYNSLHVEHDNDQVLSVSESTNYFLSELQKRKNFCTPIPSGIVELDEKIDGGFHIGALSYIVGLPGGGKTSFVLNAIKKSSLADVPSIYISYELSVIDTFARLVSTEYPISWGEVNRGNETFAKMFLEKFEGKPLYIIDGRGLKTLKQVNNKINKIQEKTGKQSLVCVDYMQQMLMYTAISEDTRLRIDMLIDELEYIAKDTQCALLIVSSAGRDSYGINQRDPEINRVIRMCKESGKTEYSATVIIGLIPATTITVPRYTWLCVAKNRYGAFIGNVPTEFDGERGSFTVCTTKDVNRALAGLSDTYRQRVMDEIRKVWNSVGVVVRNRTELVDRISGKREKIFEAVNQVCDEMCVNFPIGNEK